jgi:hypothetical protein
MEMNGGDSLSKIGDVLHLWGIWIEEVHAPGNAVSSMMLAFKNGAATLHQS